MKGILARFYAKPLSIYLVVALIALSSVAGPAEAMFLPASPQDRSTPLPDRAADLAGIQRLLESKTLQQRLVDYGLSPDKAMGKINALSDGKIHQLAAQIDVLQAGGHRIGAEELLIVLLLVLLIVIIADNGSTVYAS